MLNITIDRIKRISRERMHVVNLNDDCKYGLSSDFLRTYNDVFVMNDIGGMLVGFTGEVISTGIDMVKIVMKTDWSLWREMYESGIGATNECSGTILSAQYEGERKYIAMISHQGASTYTYVPTIFKISVHSHPFAHHQTYLPSYGDYIATQDRYSLIVSYAGITIYNNRQDGVPCYSLIEWEAFGLTKLTDKFAVDHNAVIIHPQIIKYIMNY